MELDTLPRAAVVTVLQGLRLPLIGAEALTGQRGNDAWPPAVAFEVFEAEVKQRLGSVLHDDKLLEAARLQKAKVAELRRADELEAEADEERSRADQAAKERTKQARTRRQEAAQEADRKKAAVERTRRTAKALVDEDVDEKAARAGAAVEALDKKVEADERKARLQSIEHESKAVEKQRQAVQASKAANSAADKVQSKQAERARRTNRRSP